MILRAEAIVRPGGLQPADMRHWLEVMGPHRGQRVAVTVERHHDRRSSHQNRWYWGAIVPAVCGHLSKGRPFELHRSQVHYLLKSAFIGVEETALGVVPRSSRELTTAEFSEYCERIVSHAATEWALPIPTPEEWQG
jgi:hypothetical protein